MPQIYIMTVSWGVSINEVFRVGGSPIAYLPDAAQICQCFVGWLSNRYRIVIRPGQLCAHIIFISHSLASSRAIVSSALSFVRLSSGSRKRRQRWQEGCSRGKIIDRPRKLVIRLTVLGDSEVAMRGSHTGVFDSGASLGTYLGINKYCGGNAEVRDK